MLANSMNDVVAKLLKLKGNFQIKRGKIVLQSSNNTSVKVLKINKLIKPVSSKFITGKFRFCKLLISRYIRIQSVSGLNIRSMLCV